MAVGVWTLVEKSGYLSVLASSTFAASAYILIFAGALVMVTGFLGFCAIVREDRSCLSTVSAQPPPRPPIRLLVLRTPCPRGRGPWNQRKTAALGSGVGRSLQALSTYASLGGCCCCFSPPCLSSLLLLLPDFIIRCFSKIHRNEKGVIRQPLSHHPDSTTTFSSFIGFLPTSCLPAPLSTQTPCHL